jgi:hypothetical protein
MAYPNDNRKNACNEVESAGYDSSVFDLSGGSADDEGLAIIVMDGTSTGSRLHGLSQFSVRRGTNSGGRDGSLGPPERRGRFVLDYLGSGARSRL